MCFVSTTLSSVDDVRSTIVVVVATVVAIDFQGFVSTRFPPHHGIFLFPLFVRRSMYIYVCVRLCEYARRGVTSARSNDEGIVMIVNRVLFGRLTKWYVWSRRTKMPKHGAISSIYSTPEYFSIIQYTSIYSTDVVSRIGVQPFNSWLFTHDLCFRAGLYTSYVKPKNDVFYLKRKPRQTIISHTHTHTQTHTSTHTIHPFPLSINISKYSLWFLL